MLEPSKMRPRGQRVMDDITNGAWLWKRILFSIGWYHLIPFKALRYWFNAIWTCWKSTFWVKSHKTKTKANVENLARSNLDIIPYYHDQQQYSGYQNKGLWGLEVCEFHWDFARHLDPPLLRVTIYVDNSFPNPTFSWKKITACQKLTGRKHWNWHGEFCTMCRC